MVTGTEGSCLDVLRVVKERVLVRLNETQN